VNLLNLKISVIFFTYQKLESKNYLPSSSSSERTDKRRISNCLDEKQCVGTEEVEATMGKYLMEK
jgi:hypothetical protein